AVGLADVGIEQAGHAAVVDRELEPGHVQHGHLAHADGRVARGAEARLGVDVDPGGAQLPVAVVGRTGRIGRPHQRALRALHADAVGAAVAAPFDQLVADIVDLVGVARLVAARAPGHHAHA